MIDILNGYAVQKCITLGFSCVNKNSCIMVDPCLYNITYLMIMMLYQCGIHWNKVKSDLQSSICVKLIVWYRIENVKKEKNQD